MPRSRLIFAQFFIFLLCITPLYAMDSDEGQIFEQCVSAIKNSCHNDLVTDEVYLAFLTINNKNLLAKNQKTPSYKIFQQLDLSNTFSLLPQKHPDLLQKPWGNMKLIENPLKEVTYFRLLQGKFAQHNKSVTYNDGEVSLFKYLADHDLSITKEQYRFTGQYGLCITGFDEAEEWNKQKNLVADLLEQEVCLRNNAKKEGEEKIRELEVLFKSKNPKQPVTQGQSIVASNQNQEKKDIDSQKSSDRLSKTQESNNTEIAQQPPSTPPSAAASTTTLNQSEQAFNAMTGLSNKQPDQKPAKVIAEKINTQSTEKKELPSIRLPFSKAFFISGIKFTLLIALLYCAYHYQSSLKASFNPFDKRSMN